MGAKRLIIVGLFIAAISIGSGCGMYKETRLERNWGKSFESAKTNQILNPKAGENLEPVVGLDGKTAAGALEIYQKESKSNGSKNPINLNLGNIDKIGAK
jgi:hypothetical protein